jgi:hypothetical protein
MWRRLYRAGSVASLVDWLPRGGLALIGGGAATALAIIGNLPTVAVVIVGLGVFLIALGALMAALEARTPKFVVTPKNGLRLRHTDEGNVYDSEAALEVRNARESGGRKGTGYGVTPEIAILNGDRSVRIDNVGWETDHKRNIPPTRVPHRIPVAFKEAGDVYPVADLRSPTQHMGGPLWGSPWQIRLTLRGENWRKPFVYGFVLHTGLRKLAVEPALTLEPAATREQAP